MAFSSAKETLKEKLAGATMIDVYAVKDFDFDKIVENFKKMIKVQLSSRSDHFILKPEQTLHILLA